MDNNSELQSTKTTTGINDLDVIGIESILQFLSANDLSAFSHTCSQYKDLTEQYFYRNGSCGLIKVKADGGRVCFDFNVDYTAQFVIRFRSFIRFLCVEINQDLLTETFQFIKDNCAKHLIYLNLYDSNLTENKAELVQSDGSIIAEQLRQLKVLELGQLALNGDIYDNFLKYCEKLQIIVMLPARIRPMNTSWMNKKFLRLEALIYLSNAVPSDVQYCDEAMKNFSNFLRNHRNLKAIVTDEMSLIKSLCSSETDLPYAAMAFENEDNLLSIWEQFVLCCKQKFIKLLELIVYDNLSDGTLQGIFRFDHIKSIHWFVTNVFDNTVRDIPAQPHIEQLCISFIVPLEKELLNRIVTCFPCLRELRIYLNRHNADSYKAVLMPIISRIGTLQNFYLQSIVRIPFYENDIIELHAERLNQNHTSAVNLHLCTEFVEFNAIIPENSLVLIKMYKDYQATTCPFNNFEFKRVVSSLKFLPSVDISL